MKAYLAAVLLFIMALPAALSAEAAEWRIDDDHSNAYFSIQHMTVTRVRGTFSTIAGVIHTDDSSGKLTDLSLTIDVNSIDTGVVKRDEHLKSPDFFDTVKYPTMTFVSRKVADQGNSTLQVIGDLSMHGITREVKLTLYGPSPEIKDPWGMTRLGLRLESVLNRQDFGLNYNKVLDNGGLLIGDRVDSEADLELVKTAVK